MSVQANECIAHLFRMHFCPRFLQKTPPLQMARVLLSLSAHRLRGGGRFCAAEMTGKYCCTHKHPDRECAKKKEKLLFGLSRWTAAAAAIVQLCKMELGEGVKMQPPDRPTVANSKVNKGGGGTCISLQAGLGNKKRCCYLYCTLPLRQSSLFCRK